MEQLLNILQQTCPGIDFTASDRLIDDGIIDSLDLVTLVTVLMDEYDVEISVDDLVPENFNSAQAMWDMIQTIREEE